MHLTDALYLLAEYKIKHNKAHFSPICISSANVGGGDGMKDSKLPSFVASSFQNRKRYNHPDKKEVSGFYGNVEKGMPKGGSKGVKIITTISFLSKSCYFWHFDWKKIPIFVNFFTFHEEVSNCKL